MQLPLPKSTRAAVLFGFAAAGVIGAMACALYLPFLGNPLVFDDATFFSGARFAYYATHPLGLMPRTPAYFSLAITHVLAERVEAHRAVSLVLHVGVALVLSRLVYELLRSVRVGAPAPAAGQFDLRALICATVVAAAFAVHPVAVYGAAYLVQRSVVLATFFGILSLLLFLRGVTRDDVRWTFAAAASYALAVFSKEHAILIAVVAVPLASLASPNRRRALGYLARYLGACAPAALLVLYMARQLVGQVYEPHVAEIALQMEPDVGQVHGALTWWLSAATQAGLFFRYLWLWFWPDTASLSVDWRVDFVANASPAWMAFKASSFAACGVLGAILFLRGGRAAVAGLGLLYAWILFLAELSVARFQEPFVLYRSYLWAPGFALVASAALDRVRAPFALGALVLAAPLLIIQARDRLDSFSSPLRLWADAARKLPEKAVPWGSRVLYNLGREQLYAGQPEQAIATVERCLATYPRTFQCVYARGAIELHLERYELALPHLQRAAQMQPGNGIAQHRVGLALERLGRIEEARERYRKASALGFGGGDLELGRLAR